MKIIFSALFLMAGAASACAACVGSGAFTTCYDDYGNSYSVQRSPGMTTMNGYNPQTGSTWGQQTIGGQTNGYSSDGGSWNRTDYGGGYFGTDSDGNSYSCIRTLGGQVICN